MKGAFRKLIGLLVFVVLFWAVWRFVAYNPDLIQLRFFNYRTTEMSAGLVTLFVFVAGVFISAFTFFSVVVSAQLERRRLLRENESLQRLLNEHLEASKKRTS